MKKGPNAKVSPRQEKELAISTSAVVSCLYERKQPVFIEAGKMEKGGVNNSPLCKFNDPKFYNLRDIKPSELT